MVLSGMRRHDQPFGEFRRADGEVFGVSGTVWESPAEYDYWLGYYEGRHASWGVIRLTLIIPKRIAGSITMAVALQAGAPLEQFKSELIKVTQYGKDYIWCPSNDGWTLLG